MDRGGELRGVITDWGGVLSTPILTTVRAWVQADGIDWDSYRAVMRPWVSQAYDSDGSPNPVRALEREYPRADFPGLFDTVVLSGEVGMRKPEKEIFLHTAQTLGLPPEECVFVDDMEANVAAAQACGMTGVLHTETAATAQALQDLLGVPLAWSAPAT